MKAESSKSFQITAAALAAVLLAGFPAAPSVQAGTIDWNGANTTWGTGSNWIGGVVPADDLVTDIARFNLTDYSGKAPNSGTRSVNGMIFGDGATTTGVVTLTTGTLSLGSSGIVMNSNAGAVTVNGRIHLGANQTWTNNSANTLTVNAAIANAGDISPFKLTLSGAGSIAFAGNIQNGGATGTTAIEVNKTSGTVNFSAVSRTFSGGLAIKSGTVTFNDASNALGTGAITLGDSSGSANATLGGATFVGNAVNNAIHVAAGSTGQLRIGGAAGMTIGGAITLANDLHIGGASGTTIFSGGVTGTGNLIVDSGGGFNTNTNALNMNGTLTVMGAQNMTLAGGIGSNVTAISAGASGGELQITGLLNVNSNGTTITTLSTSKTLGVTGGTAGTGDLVIVSSLSASVTGAKVNHEGALIFSGTGATARTLNAPIGSNVKEIVISGNGGINMRSSIEVNANGTTLRNDTAKQFNFLGTASVVSGTGDFILKNNGSLANGILLGGLGEVNTLNNVGRLINSGTGSGSVSVNAHIGSNVTGVEQDSATSTLILTSSNVFTGQTLVKSGTLSVNNANALQFSTLNTGTSTGTQVVTFNQNSNLGGLTGSKDINVGAGARTLNIGANNENTVYSGALIGTNLNIVKTGTGTLVLTGTNNFGTGLAGDGTTINSGALMINNGLGGAIVGLSGGVSGAGGGNIVVNSGGIFGGTGYVKPGTGRKISVANGGYLSAGDRTGNTLGAMILDGAGTTANLLTMASGSKFSFRVDDTSNDRIDFWNFAAGDLALSDNTVEISLLGEFSEGEHTYTLFNFYNDNGDMLTSGIFSGLNLSFVSGFDESRFTNAYLDYDYGSVNLMFTVVIPEPSTWALMAGSLLVVAGYSRRSRAKVASR